MKMNTVKDLCILYFKEKRKGHRVQKKTVEGKTAKVVIRRKRS